MDVGRVATIYMRAREPLVGSEMAFTLTFRVPYDATHLLDGFEALVRAHPELRLRFERRESAWQWVLLSDGDVERALADQRRWFERTFTIEEVQSTRLVGQQGLPIRILRADERRLIVQMSHLLGNGLRALQWIEDWLAGERPAPAPTPASASANLSRAAVGPRGWMWLLAFAAQFVVRAGWNPARNTVDLTYGKAPVPHLGGYAIKTYPFSVETTREVLARCRAQGLSVTQALCAAMASALLAAQTDKTRVCISVPTNLARLADGSRERTPGDYTGHLIVQVFRGGALGPQVLRSFQWVSRCGIDALLLLATAAMAGSETALYEKFAATAARPMPQRAPFQNHSCTVSSLGTIEHPTVSRIVETLSACTHTQSVSVSIVTIAGRLSMEVIVARDLYDPAEVFRVTDDAVNRLLGVALL